MERSQLKTMKLLLDALTSPAGMTTGYVHRSDVNLILNQFVNDNYEGTVPADNFVATVAANVDNGRLEDEDFREFVRNTLPIVKYNRN
jgi:hypothetical protein